MHEDLDSNNAIAAASLIAEAWSELNVHWNERDQHHQFVALCDELDKLDWAATRYAQVRTERPGDPFVRKMCAEIVLRAGLRLERERKRRPEASAAARRVKVAALILGLLLVPLLFLRSIVQDRATKLERSFEATRVALGRGNLPAARQHIQQILERDAHNVRALELRKQLEAQEAAPRPAPPSRTPATAPLPPERPPQTPP